MMVRSGVGRDCRRFSGGLYAELEEIAAAEGATIDQRCELSGKRCVSLTCPRAA
jgi:hypothetical protein